MATYVPEASLPTNIRGADRIDDFSPTNHSDLDQGYNDNEYGGLPSINKQDADMANATTTSAVSKLGGQER